MIGVAVDPVREVAARIAATYCDDHPNYFSWRDCRIRTASRLARSFNDPIMLEHLDWYCHQQAKEALAKGGDYTQAYKACIERHLGAGR